VDTGGAVGTVQVTTSNAATGTATTTTVAVDPATGAFTAPAPAATGTYTASVTATDVNGNTATADATQDYVVSNNNPVATDDESYISYGLKGEYYGANTQINNISDFRAIVNGNAPAAT